MDGLKSNVKISDKVWTKLICVRWSEAGIGHLSESTAEASFARLDTLNTSSDENMKEMGWILNLLGALPDQSVAT